MQTRPKERIIVLRGGALGDFVLTVPLLKAARMVWPGCILALGANPGPARLAKETGLADEVHSLEAAGAASLFCEGGISDEWRAMARDSKVILDLLHDPDGIVERNLRTSAGGMVLTHSPLVGAGTHACDHFLAVMEPLAGRRFPAVPRMEFPVAVRAKALDILQSAGLPRILIHPGSGGSRKNWPAEKFAGAATILRRRGIPSAFIIGEADRVAGESLNRILGSWPTVQGLDVVTLGAVLSQAQGYLGNDSGVTHLAAAAGVPRLVALFGPTDPLVWGPRGEGVRIVRADPELPGGLAELDVERVCGEFSADL